MKLRGEITIFLSLIVICILSLIMGLLESARTTGARLYAQMAADSAAASVMSHYNRNLWDMYHLLSLEAESTKDIEKSFSEYLDFYCGRRNLYPMELGRITITETNMMMDDGGIWLEDGTLSYVQYRLPEIIQNVSRVVEDTEDALKAGDIFRVFEISGQIGLKTRAVEQCRMEIEECISEIEEHLSELYEAADQEQEGTVRREANQLIRKLKQFPNLVKEYKREIQKLSDHRKQLETSMEISDTESEEQFNRELDVYQQVEESSEELLEQYQELENETEAVLACLEEALEILDEENYEYVPVVKNENAEIKETGSLSPVPSDTENLGQDVEMVPVPIGPDWDAVQSCISSLEFSGGIKTEHPDKEKLDLLDKLQVLLGGNLMDIVLPEHCTISNKATFLTAIPSKSVKAGEKQNDQNYISEEMIRKALVNEYCFLSFDSFLKPSTVAKNRDKQELLYELEYLLCGESSDEENLKETVEKLLAIRGAINFLCLLRTPELQAETDGFLTAISGGNTSMKAVLSFFVWSLWALGEAILDAKSLLKQKGISFWKDSGDWQLGFNEFLAMEFLEIEPQKQSGESGYEDHLKVLLLLANPMERNFRMMDLIQWNVKMIQKDFSIDDCYCNVSISAEIKERHLFMMNNRYTRIVEAQGIY